MFGIGMSELLVIAIIGLVVIGPKQLPEVARTLGRMFAQFKRTTNDLREQVDREVKQFTELEEVKEFKNSMEGELTDVKSTAESYVERHVAEAEKALQLEEDAARAGPNNGDSGSLDAPAIASADAPAAATANSVEFTSGGKDDGGLPPGKLPS